MKVLKLPVDTKISCDCGCEFEFDLGDVVTSCTYYDVDEIDKIISVNCPFCNSRHVLARHNFHQE